MTVPKLRFPEFRDAGEWEEKKLDDVSSFINQKVPLEKVSLFNYISTENLLPDYAGVTTASKLPPLGSATQFLKNDVLISNIRPYLKKVWFADKDGAASNDVIVIRAKASVINEYLAFLLKNDKFIDYVMEGAKGVKMPRGDISLIRQYPLAIPSLTEQQTIADCLASLDDRLSAETQTIDTLKAHKKGLMQQLFPAEGETLPKLRFPEFRDAGEWEEMPLSKVGEIITGNTPKTANLDNYGGYRLFVSPADICDERYVYKTKTTLSEQGFKQTRQIKANSILFVCIGSTIGKVAQNKFECATNQQINSIVPFAEYCSDFIYSSLENSSIKISSLAGNHAVPIINKTLFSSVLIRFPSLPEQQTIADCLGSLDETIAAQAETIALLKVHKKGLMQQLFPAVEDAKR